MGTLQERAMTPEQIQKAVQYEMGWREAFPPKEDCHPLMLYPRILLPYKWVNVNTGEMAVDEPPQYIKDLNACAAMEDTLKDEDHWRYWLQICELYGNSSDPSIRNRATISAKPLIRCEAFLRVKGLWEEKHMSTKYNWMEEARQQAAQCWCDDETSSMEMNTVLAEAVAKRIAVWMEEAARSQVNCDYYRGLVIRCGEVLGKAARTCDDGTLVDHVLCAKVPELVEQLMENSKKRDNVRDSKHKDDDAEP